MNNTSEQYTGHEWEELLSRLNPRQLKKALRSAYRKVGTPLRKMAQASLLSRGPKDIQGNRRDWRTAIRFRGYPMGCGFMLTLRPHGSKGFHTNRRGLQKPVLLFAEEGTQERRTRRGGFERGRMPAYGFMKAVEPELYDRAQRDLVPELDKALDKAAREAGF